MEEVLKDERFSGITTDPRFRKIPHAHRKVIIGDRFKGMFTDKRFKLTHTMDQRGRPVRPKTSGEDLMKFYELEDQENTVSEDTKVSKKMQVDEAKRPTCAVDKTKVQRLNVSPDLDKKLTSSTTKKKKSKSNIEPKSSDREGLKHDEGKLASNVANEVLTGQNDISRDQPEDVYSESEEPCDALRDVGQSSSNDLGISSSDDDVSSSDEEITIEHPWAELDNAAPTVDDATHRLAICNVDWDRLKAQDLMALCSSFTQTGGVVRRVTIYPSEYGLARMAEERQRGPSGIISREARAKGRKKKGEQGNETQEIDTFERENLRLYQINRLKYFYAIVICDSANTAQHIYTQLDGQEYETSSSRLDLRFVPDDMQFTQEPREEASTLLDLATFKPSSFVTTALNQSKVDLTWDETDRSRSALLMKKYKDKELKELETEDLNAYLVNSSDSDAGEVGGAFETGDANPYAGIEVVHPSDYQHLLDMDQHRQPDDGTVVNDDALLKETEDKAHGETTSIKKKLKVQAGDFGVGQALNGVNDLAMDTKLHEDENPDNMEMEIRWEPELDAAITDLSKKKIERKLTPFEELLQKRRERRKERRQRRQQKTQDTAREENSGDEDDAFSTAAAGLAHGVSTKNVDAQKGSSDHTGTSLELLAMDSDDGREHFDLRKLMDQESFGMKKKKKRKRKLKEHQNELKTNEPKDTFVMDTEDSRFSEIFTSHLFNVDPSAPEYKKTIGMEALVRAKSYWRAATGAANTSTNPSPSVTAANEPVFVKGKSIPVPSLQAHMAGHSGGKTKPASRLDVDVSMLVKAVKSKSERNKTNKRERGFGRLAQAKLMP